MVNPTNRLLKAAFFDVMLHVSLLRTLVLIIALSLFTLLAVQFYWLNNAIRLEQQNFVSQANSAINDIAKRMEGQEALDALYRAARRTDETQHPRFPKGLGLTVPSNGGMVADQYNQGREIDLYGNRINQLNFSVMSQATAPIDTATSYLEQLLGDKDLAANRSLMVEFVKEIQLSRQKLPEARLNKFRLDSVINQVFDNYGIKSAYTYSLVKADNAFFKKIAAENKAAGSQQVFFGKMFPSDLVPTHTYIVIRFVDQQTYFFRNIARQLAMSLLALLLLGFSFYMLVSLLFRQKRLSELKTDFINNMTHELKTPIATINLASEALFDQWLNQDSTTIQRYNQIIYDENQRLKNHVERILNIALLEKSGFSLQQQQLDIHQLLNKVIEQSELRIKQHGAVVNLKLEATQVRIAADEMHLINVFTNLIDNALKYTKQKPVIEIKTSSTRIGISIAVTDNGIGMSVSQQKKVFDKFYRVPTGDVHDVKGFGLGLAYVKTIIELHGGNIQLTSETGKGSTFIIYLPFEQQKHE